MRWSARRRRWNVCSRPGCCWLGGLRACSARSAGAIGGYRRRLVASSSAGCSSPARLYWYADRVVLGMVGARELPLGEAPPSTRRVERLAAAGRRAEAAALRDSGRPARGHSSAGRGPARRAIAVSTRPARRAAPPAELEGVLAHELAHIRNRDVLVQTTAVVLAAALVETSRIGGWLAARAALRPRPGRGGVRPSAALAEARVRGRPARGRNSAARRTAWRTRCSGSSRRASSSSSRRARRPSRCTRQPVRRGRARRRCS